MVTKGVTCVGPPSSYQVLSLRKSAPTASRSHDLPWRREIIDDCWLEIQLMMVGGNIFRTSLPVGVKVVETFRQKKMADKGVVVLVQHKVEKT